MTTENIPRKSGARGRSLLFVPPTRGESLLPLSAALSSELHGHIGIRGVVARPPTHFLSFEKLEAALSRSELPRYLVRAEGRYSSTDSFDRVPLL